MRWTLDILHSDGTPRGMGPVMEHSHIVDCVIRYLNSIIVIIHIFRVYTPKMYSFWDLHIPPYFIGNIFLNISNHPKNGDPG